MEFPEDQLLHLASNRYPERAARSLGSAARQTSGGELVAQWREVLHGGYLVAIGFATQQQRDERTSPVRRVTSASSDNRRAPSFDPSRRQRTRPHRQPVGSRELRHR